LEVYLSVDDEKKLQEQALRHVLDALIIRYIERSPDPKDELSMLRDQAQKLNIGSHSYDASINDYCRNQIAAITDLYFDRFRVGRKV